MKKLICAAALGLLFVTASEVTYASDVVTLVPTQGGGYTGTFGLNANGIFQDTFTFLPTTFAGEVMIDLKATGPVTFFTALLNRQGFSYLPENGNKSFDFKAVVGTDQPLQLLVSGFSGDASTLTAMPGSYAGSISISAVPEPASVALWLAGLVFVQSLVWRRRTTS